MKIKFLKLKNWLLMTAMGLFGLTACHSAKEAATEPVSSQGISVSTDGQDEAAKGPATDDERTPARPRPRGEAALMYGVPTIDFVLKGRVIDAQGKPVQGMQVILVNQTVDISPDDLAEDNEYVQNYIRNASDTTEADGSFECHMKDVPNENQRVIVRDPSQAKDGHYQDQMIQVNFTKEDQTAQGQGWYVGTRTKDVDITVQEK